VLIIDDEELAREGVRILLENFPDVEITGECANGFDAVSMIQEKEPDLVFLDVQMPVMDGFEVIEKIGADKMPLVIFVTAYDKYALRAFEIYAFDYLLKPIDDERFAETFQRAALRFGQSETGIRQQLAVLLEELKLQRGQRADNRPRPAAPEYPERIVVKTAKRIFFVGIEDVDYFKAADNYVEIHVGRKLHLIRETMTGLESRINPRQFVRINRSIIVNVKRIKELQPLFNGEFAVILQNGTELISSRRFRKNLDILLNS
jgi:two-component system, LytTR family, response regulator